MGKTHDEDEIEIDLRELFFALKKRILIILAALVAGAVIAGAYTKLLITPVYSATSTMLVLTKETTLSSLADLQIGTQLTGDYSILIKSRTVLEDVIDELGLEMDYRTLRSNVTINNPEDTRILELTVTNSDPQMAKEIVDTLSRVSSDFIGDQMEIVGPKIIEEGEVPTAQTSPSLKKNVMLGAIAGFVLAAGVIVLMTILNDTIKSEDDIEKYLGIPTLANIPDRKDYISGKASKKKKRKKRRRQEKWQNKK
ncbi:polysaccharide export protein [Lachnoclostridium sp. An169]|uniref:YveK family protein n=1 Tax=Lachnoclostridium sp. An169 TaxID=1965569 RepID=UPI000B3663FF|nr:Wzz/FepE/Etk N-terminal domain-containing protein [Lachnoclostridium sp. An169]OUP82408.1 polysaccharide export protein [Lachnoclostridium sp. An169]